MCIRYLKNNSCADDLSTIQNQVAAVEMDWSNNVTPKYKDVGIQVKLHEHKTMRSKYVQNVPVMQDISCSTEQKRRQNVIVPSTSTSTSTNVTSVFNDTLNDCDDEYLSSEETSEEAVKQNALEQRRLMRNMKMMIIQNKQKMYLGIPDNAFFFIQLLSKETGIRIEEICLTITKIKLNDSFAKIGDDFGITASNASTVFRRTLPVIAHYLKQLIVWPSKESIKLNLPLPFRARYSHVQSIIDCLEIEIQKPSNAINQSVTWSEYKKCNTLKYLISMTPNGTINFISEGFCGRTSDATIVELSQYLNELPDNCAVMVDRGFKNIEHLLQKKGCILIRPPSVSSNSKPTKEEVIETRRIASLRIHVERVIRRIRKFNILKPHSTIHHDTIDTVDDMIIVAAGLINIQLPLIAQ